MANNRDYAKRIMVHYFRLIAVNAGVPLTWESVSEIEAAVDAMIDAAKAEFAEEAE